MSESGPAPGPGPATSTPIRKRKKNTPGDATTPGSPAGKPAAADADAEPKKRQRVQRKPSGPSPVTAPPPPNPAVSQAKTEPTSNGTAKTGAAAAAGAQPSRRGRKGKGVNTSFGAPNGAPPAPAADKTGNTSVANGKAKASAAPTAAATAASGKDAGGAAQQAAASLLALKSIPDVAFANVKVRDAAAPAKIKDNLHVPVRPDSSLAGLQAYLIAEMGLPAKTPFSFSYTDATVTPPEQYTLTNENRFNSFKQWALNSPPGTKVAVDAIIGQGANAVVVPNRPVAGLAPTSALAESSSLAEIASKSAVAAATEAVAPAETSTAPSTSSSRKASGCGICSSPTAHPVESCPWIIEGDAVKLKTRFDQLKDLQQRKKGPERTAQKNLKEWLKANVKTRRRSRKTVADEVNATASAEASHVEDTEAEGGDADAEGEDDDDDELAAEASIPAASSVAASKAGADGSTTGCIICSSPQSHKVDDCPWLTPANSDKVRSRLVTIKTLPNRQLKVEKKLGTWLKGQGVTVPRMKRGNKAAEDSAISASGTAAPNDTVALGTSVAPTPNTTQVIPPPSGEPAMQPSSQQSWYQSDATPTPTPSSAQPQAYHHAQQQQQHTHAHHPHAHPQAPPHPPAPVHHPSSAATSSTSSFSPYTKLTNLQPNIFRNSSLGFSSLIPDFGFGSGSGGGGGSGASQSSHISTQQSVGSAGGPLGGAGASGSPYASMGAHPHAHHHHASTPLSGSHAPAPRPGGPHDGSNPAAAGQDDDEDEEEDEEDDEEEDEDDEDDEEEEEESEESIEEDDSSDDGGNAGGGGGNKKKVVRTSHVPPEKRLGGSATKKAKKPKNALAGL
ncbi:hypothetical protein OC844_003970 [Tilletia horrida]|nr:hypothetical protein OC844_003970 [Tilletia horrida]